MGLYVESVFDKVTNTLQDDGVRWSPEELLRWFNDGQRQICRFHPEAYTINEATALAAGSKQTLPETGLMLVKVINNMGTDGATEGDVITHIDQDIMDAQSPSWHSTTQSATIKHYMFDPRDPKTYFVYPPADGTTQIRIVYSKVPPDAEIGGTSVIDNIYEPDLVSYILYWAYQKDADFGANHARTQGYLQAFMASMGVIEPQEHKMEPKDK